MNLLMVDDDAYVIETMEKKMEWEKLGIARVFTAYTVKQAKRWILGTDIHIVICDIEMPKENGFVLLEWVREKRFDIQFIFLTSYAEFEYARKALSLKSCAYLLKPIAYSELAQEITKAVNAWKDTREGSAGGEYIPGEEQANKRRDMFFARYCINGCCPGSKELWEDIVSLRLGFLESDQFIPLLIVPLKQRLPEGEYGRGQMERIARELVEELFLGENINIAGCALTDTECLVVFRNGAPEDREMIYRHTYELIDRLEAEWDTAVICMVGEYAGLAEVFGQYREMKQELKKYIFGKSGIYEPDRNIFAKERYEAPDFPQWERLFREGQEEKLRAQLSGYIRRSFGQNHVSQKILMGFVMDFLQMLGASLKEHKVLIHSLDGSDGGGAWLDTVTRSLEQMENYLLGILHRGIEAMNSQEKSRSAVEYVKQYIADNLEKNITRESLSELVYLHPDYLARLFKRECGESINSYLLRLRMEKARDALITQESSINAVALSVGYDNFSYFSKVFKDTWGMTPKDYRKAFKEKEK